MRGMVAVLRALGAKVRALFLHEVWNIGIVDEPVEAFLASGARPPVRWLPEPSRGFYFADPFMVETDDDLVILAEGFFYADRRGYIVAFSATRGEDFGPPTVVIREPIHLSYPYVVQYQGRTFCVPESGEAREVRLYEATDFPRTWVRRATLIENFAVLDATIFEYEGRWWLLCSEMDGTDGATLHAWHAPDLYGPWSPHAANPIKRDIGSARPAGPPFVHDGNLYRPGQNSTGGYGRAVVIHRVLRLTPTEFAEEPVATVEPYTDGPYRWGLHTIAACGRCTVIDGMRYRFIPHEFRRRLVRRLTSPLRDRCRGHRAQASCRLAIGGVPRQAAAVSAASEARREKDG